jgi:hypothetical protein
VLKGKFASSVFQSCKEKTPKTRKLVSGPQCVNSFDMCEHNWNCRDGKGEEGKRRKRRMRRKGEGSKKGAKKEKKQKTFLKSLAMNMQLITRHGRLPIFVNNMLVE